MDMARTGSNGSGIRHLPRASADTNVQEVVREGTRNYASHAASGPM